MKKKYEYPLLLTISVEDVIVTSGPADHIGNTGGELGNEPGSGED